MKILTIHEYKAALNEFFSLSSDQEKNRARLLELREALNAFELLFSGGPPTPIKAR